MTEVDEIMQTIEHLQQVLEDLIVRGVRSAGAPERATLAHLRDEFQRVGAHHLAARVGALCAAIDADDRTAPTALFKAQASLRVFERTLTLEVAHGALSAFIEAKGAGDEPE